MSDHAPLGFTHSHSIEQLRAYRELTAEQKLSWLYSAWRMTVDFLPAGKLEIYQAMRRGLEGRKPREEADHALRVCLASLTAHRVITAEEKAPPGELALNLVRTLPNGSKRYARVWWVEETTCYMVQWGAFGNVEIPARPDEPFRSPLNFDARTFGPLAHVVAFARTWLGDLVDRTLVPSGCEPSSG